MWQKWQFAGFQARPCLPPLRPLLLPCEQPRLTCWRMRDHVEESCGSPAYSQPTTEHESKPSLHPYSCLPNQKRTTEAWMSSVEIVQTTTNWPYRLVKNKFLLLKPLRFEVVFDIIAVINISNCNLQIYPFQMAVRICKLDSRLFKKTSVRFSQIRIIQTTF